MTAAPAALFSPATNVNTALFFSEQPMFTEMILPCALSWIWTYQDTDVLSVINR